MDNTGVTTTELQSEIQQQNQEQQNQNTDLNMKDNKDIDDMLLGKFKSVNDLANAYKNMESHLGQQTKELGELREQAKFFDTLKKYKAEWEEKSKSAQDFLTNVVKKYEKDEYFKNQEFTNMFKEAFKLIGTNLDVDKFVSLIDKYALARISMNDKQKAAKKETENAKSQMQFLTSSANKNTEFAPNLDALTPQQIDEYVAKYI